MYYILKSLLAASVIGICVSCAIPKKCELAYQAIVGRDVSDIKASFELCRIYIEHKREQNGDKLY